MVRKKPARIFRWLLLPVLFWQVTVFSEEFVNPITTNIPAGFEDLTKPQMVVADLYYGGQMIGAVQITVHPTVIEFHDPAAVMKLLPLPLNPERVEQLLQQPQSKNTDRICQNAAQIDCGFMSPKDFAVIYNNNQYRLDVFFSPDLLPQQVAISDPYLPPSSSEFSLIQNLSAAWAGNHSDEADNSYHTTFNGNTIIGYGEKSLRSQWHYSDEQGYQVSNLYWAKDFRGKNYSAGLFQPQGNFGYFNTSRSVFGVEFRNSRLTRTDLSYQEGAPVEINMPVRGRVEVYRENRLVHSELLDAGNRLLDTSSLPSGAYEIEVRTFDESGRPLTSFTEFFAKDFYLPAPGEWHWSLLAGMPTDSGSYRGLPGYYNEGLVQAYLGRRVSDNIALFSTISATENQQSLELGARWIGTRLELSPNFLVGRRGQKGYRFEGLFELPFATLNASISKLYGDKHLYPRDEYPLLRHNFSHKNIGIQSLILGGNLSLRYSERSRTTAIYSDNIFGGPDSNNTSKFTTLAYRRSLIKKRNWFGDITFSYNKSDNETYSSIDFQLRYYADQWQHFATALREFGNNQRETPHRLSFESRWNDRELWSAEVEQALGIENTDDGYYLESRTRLSGRQGFINSAVNYSKDGNNRTTNYLGSFSTNIIATSKKFAWGGERAYESAIIVDIDGSENNDFEVLVDGSRHGYAKGGKKSVINLLPYRSYDVTLRPLDDGFFEFKEKSQFITLYPGNVSETNYSIQSLYVIMGRLTSFGNGIPETLVSIGEHEVITDQFGVFQLEVPIEMEGNSTLEVKWLNCSISVQVEDSGENWINLGTLQQSDAYCLPAFEVSEHNEKQ
ncbi:TcfC E-set like domain-containing protein [Microbulbifer variabilis]|uniref:TcfC E-set like domain-containing protein n=1 Tax=Microbulbifer variabilis TaxID=266805 RepID=UPI001CFCD98B|nr:TcfC E-set like domain-containing protein [Microbulbifer variabilis]